MKTILILNAGDEAIPGIIKAKKMGLNVVVCDKDNNAPGFKYADHKINESIYKGNKLLKKVISFNKKKRKIHGVIAMASDTSLMVAKILKKLKLNGISLKTAQLSTNKLLMKKRLKKCGISLPWFEEIKNKNQLRKILNKYKCKFVIKPVDNRGARGVLQVDYKSDIDWCYKYCLAHSYKKKIIIERFINGKQVSTEAIIYNDKSITPGIIDRNYEYMSKFKPHIIENGGQQPSSLNGKQIKMASDITVKSARCLGINKGTVKGDIVFSGGKAYLIEIASRLSGGWMSSDQIKLGTGVDFMKLALQIAMGKRINIDKIKIKKKSAVAIRYLFPTNKKIFLIPKKKQIKKSRYIKKFKLYLKNSNNTQSVTDHTKRAGFVISAAKNKKKAVFEANKFIDYLTKI